jgi:methionyl-tRNA formyltransferase
MAGVPLRIALFGQAPLAVGCLDGLLGRGLEIAGVFAPPDAGRPDPLVARAEAQGLPVVRRRHYQKRSGEPIAEAVEAHRALGADLNVLASFTSFLPPAITDAPSRGSLCFHPSLLPRYRGGNAMHWQIIRGERETGVTIFVPDAGVDTGPIAVQRGGVAIGPHDTTGTLFFEKLCPLGVEALLEAVDQIARGTERPVPQDESLATHQGLVDDRVARIDLALPADVIDRLVRGCDPQPGAWLRAGELTVRLFDARLEPAARPGARPGTLVEIDERGLRIAFRGADLRVARVRADQSKEPAHAFAKRHALAPGSTLS